jgi:hypothetical protein
MKYIIFGLAMLFTLSASAQDRHIVDCGTTKGIMWLARPDGSCHSEDKAFLPELMDHATRGETIDRAGAICFRHIEEAGITSEGNLTIHFSPKSLATQCGSLVAISVEKVNDNDEVADLQFLAALTKHIKPDGRR